MSKKPGDQERRANRYALLIERIFLDRFRQGTREVHFEREDLVRYAKRLRIKLPKNLGDIPYTFRYRVPLPPPVRESAPEGEEWVIRGVGDAKYCFALMKQPLVLPNALLVAHKIPDSTPGVIEKYALSDEQALLAKLRYNRLVDLFTGLTCYPLQSHLRTKVPQIGQVETDEIYIGLDRRGVHYVLPVQAKGGRDKLGFIQIEQDFAMCEARFASLLCRPIAAQFMANDVIAVFEFVRSDGQLAVAAERHYRLVPSDEVSDEDLRSYAALSL